MCVVWKLRMLASFEVTFYFSKENNLSVLIKSDRYYKTANISVHDISADLTRMDSRYLYILQVIIL